MATVTGGRILIHLQKKGKDQVPRLAGFAECVVDYFDGRNGQADVCVRLENNRLIISNDFLDSSLKLHIKHPSFCPIKNLSPDHGELPEAVLSRGICSGVAIILESADNKVLLTKRAPHLRAFPNIWVPPGGHVDPDETLTQAGLRELREETGLVIKESDCLEGSLVPLALWESVYPPRLSLGAPLRHHIVLYLHAVLTPQLTSDVLFKQLKFDPNEVSACTWVDKKTIEAIVKVNEEMTDSVQHDPALPQTLRALLLDDQKNQVEADIPLDPFIERSRSDGDCERVSTGTKYALEQFLLKKE
ncbi:m7GpppN-mRNA hydrolase NUDT17-like isoform X1 [Babylonia areolata]